jgi:hypothetical protein
MHEESSESPPQGVKRIPLPIHFVLFTVRSNDSVTQDVHVHRVAVTIWEDPPRLGPFVCFPPRFQNRGQLVSERHDSVFARLRGWLLFAVDIRLADSDGRTRQINRLPLQGGNLTRSQARPDTDGKNALGELYVPIAPAIAVFFEVRYYRFDFFLGERFSLFRVNDRHA